ncbi:DUF4860 domain-containing protein [Flintibacter muris]|uniref:DUF4860 domain-containing protein n=1 Tax=Flintibacter muris TaxID=2941327 RepID=UPI00203FCA57|nr:DUF4860 domain-containing protein [Flintibacter muris]
MKQKPIQHHIDGLAALLLFGVFAACVLAVLLTGADAYRRLTARDQAAFDRRTGVQYITTKVRQADAGYGGIVVENIEGVQTLILDAQAEYITYIYQYDGWLWELYTWCGEPMVPGDGRQLVESEGFALSLEEQLLTVEITAPGGVKDTLLLNLRSGEGIDA